jgi:hypothetical protein
MGVLDRGDQGGVPGKHLPGAGGAGREAVKPETSHCYPSVRCMFRFSRHATNGRLVWASPEGADAGGIFRWMRLGTTVPPGRHAYRPGSAGHSIPVAGFLGGDHASAPAVRPAAGSPRPCLAGCDLAEGRRGWEAACEGRVRVTADGQRRRWPLAGG